MNRLFFLSIFIIGLVGWSCNHTALKRKPIGSKKMKSMVLTGYGYKSYSASRVKTYLQELKALKANTASFLYTCYVADKKSHKIDCDSFDSPSREEISEAIGMAKRQGFLVNLRVYIDISDYTWRCYWKPEKKQKAFDQLQKVLLSMAQLAEKKKVELLIIGAELCQLTTSQYTQKWKSIIKNLRKVYSGKLSYGANWGIIEGTSEWQTIGFWKELDYMGIDHYLPLPENLPLYDIKDYQKIHFNKYHELAKKLKKPILFTELAFPGAHTGHLSPAEWRLKGHSDQARQAANYRQTLQAIKDSPQIEGVFIWRKLAEPVEEMKKVKRKALNYKLYKRDAWYEIQKFFNHY